MSGRLIIGCGAGRTGTTSLAHLLNSQPGSHVSHEKKKYSFHWGKPPRLFQKIKQECLAGPDGIYGDVALQWGSCLPYVLSRGARVLVLKRDLEPWLESWKHKTGRRNNWQPPAEGGTPRAAWYKSFPKFSGCSSMSEALIKYWEHYYNELVPQAQERWPDSVAMFYVDALNSEAGQRKILDFCQEPREGQVIRVGLRKNLGRHRKGIPN